MSSDPEDWPTAPYSLLEILEASANDAEAQATGSPKARSRAWRLPPDHPLSVLLSDAHAGEPR